MTDEEKKAIKWFEAEIEWYEKEYPLHFLYPCTNIVEAYKSAIKALHTVEIIKEELGPEYEENAIWLDVPHFEEIQERAEKRADMQGGGE